MDCEDTLGVIFSHVSAGATYKSVRLVSKMWCHIIQKCHGNGTKFCNHLLTLLEKFPEKPWKWEGLSQNPNFTLDALLKYRDKIERPSVNPNITWDFVAAHPEFTWNMYTISHHPNITFDIMMANLSAGWWWEATKYNPNITQKIVDENRHIPWGYNKVAKLPPWLLDDYIGLTWDEVRNNVDGDWHWGFISSHQCITQEIIAEHPNFPWDWDYVSYNPNITWEFICKNMDKSWDWCNVSELSIITQKIIEENPIVPWSWQRISSNPNITWDFVIKNIDKPWSWERISHNRFGKN